MDIGIDYNYQWFMNFIHFKSMFIYIAILLFKLNSDVFADFSKLDGIAKIS